MDHELRWAQPTAASIIGNIRSAVRNIEAYDGIASATVLVRAALLYYVPQLTKHKWECAKHIRALTRHGLSAKIVRFADLGITMHTYKEIARTAEAC